MALRELLLPWDAQPQEAGVALAPRFAAARRGFVFNAGPGSLGDGSIGLSTINSAYTGPRFGPTPDGVGMRLYADHGGNNDDRPQSSFVLPTAKSANLTTVLVFAAINNTYMQGWGPTGHYLSIADPSTYKVQCGYFGDNGFNYIFEDARSDVFDGRAHTLVISTHITAKQISVSWDGSPCTYLSGSLSYIGGGSIPATGQPYLGDRVWPNYYNPNGHLLLWAYLPDVFLAQGEAHELARNPWSLFEPRRIFVPVVAGGGGTTVNAGIGAATATGLQADISLGTTVSAGVGESTAAGSTADISLGTTINAGVGSAVADGSAASVSRGATVNASIGAAVAAGLDADISTSAGEYQVGNAVADGATASISLGTTVSANVSNAVAAGSTADVSLGTTVAAGVGNAVADGLSATITAGQTVSATVGDAVADGKTATITNDPVSTGIDLSFYGWDIFPEEVPKEKDNLRKYILDAVRDLSPKPLQREVAKRATARILPPPVFVPRNLMVREIRLAVAEIVEAANEERRRKVRKYNETIMLWM